MADFFYFDQTNQKQGPVSEQQLKELAAQGVIRPHTQMETADGHKGTARQIPGLTFGTTRSAGTVRSTAPEWYATASIICGIIYFVWAGLNLGERFGFTFNGVLDGAWGFWLGQLCAIAFVAGMFWGCRAWDTNKATIAKIGLLLCVIAFFIPRLYWWYLLVMRGYEFA